MKPCTDSKVSDHTGWFYRQIKAALISDFLMVGRMEVN